MGRRGPFRLGIALAVVLVVQQTLAGEVCRTGCQGAAQTFKYSQGLTYKYNYEGKIDISLSSAEGQATSTEVKALVLLTQLADCNQVLRLQNVQVLGTNGKKFGSIPDVEKPIRINFNDGIVTDSICAEPADSQNSLNIKRAIASLFQVNFKGNYETDVFGLCPTEIVKHQDGNTLVVQKSRNLNKCSYRENLRQDFFSTAFNLHSEIKSSPLLEGEYSSKLSIRNGILEEANVVENYLYVPFSVGKNGAKAQITTKLQLAGTSKDNAEVQDGTPRSIIFDNPHPIVSPTSNVNTILNAVKEVVKTIDVVVGEQTAKEFVSLVKTVRLSKKDDLLAAYNQVKSGVGFGDKNAAKRAFLDAILQAGVGDTVEVAITLLKNNQLSEIEKKLVYLGLTWVRHASESSLTTAESLLDQRNLPFEGYLGIGNLAGRFCRQHSCEKVEAINKLSQKLIQKLGKGKAANRAEENEVIYVLKALSNFGYLDDAHLQKIINIAQDKQAPNRLRVVALESYLADPCKDKLRNSALHILQDIQQDSEVRIKAYLALVQCPNAKIGKAVKALLEKEPSYQVGGFIVSHIRNIKASANPDKELAKQHLGFSVSKKFPIDPRKYSFNGEFSYAVDTLGIAASTETNVIYSQDAFLPRSSSLNLTAEVFGHTFNFLEIQTRQENLEKLIEHYFGPRGILRTSSFGELLKKNEQFANNIYERLNQKLGATLRARRDVSRDEINKIGNAVQIKENKLNKDLDVDISLKAFGSEIFFNNLNIYQSGLTPEGIIDKIVGSFAKGLDKLKNFKETLRSNLIFLDGEFDYPTSLGFPLRLAVEGTSNIQVNTEGNVDVRALLNGKDSNVHVKLIPSANIEVAGKLTLDALVVENGLKVVASLYTATGGDLSVALSNNNRGIEVKFGLPVQEQKLISATHEIVFHTRDQSGQETNLPLKFAQGKDFSICLDQLSPFIGLAFCGEINGPNVAGKQTNVLPFPLAGDSKIALTIENEDISELLIKNVINDEYTSEELIIETIGKDQKPKVHVQLNIEAYPEKFIKAVFDSPIKSAFAEGRIFNNDKEKSLLLKVGHDKIEFYGKVGIAISGTSDRAVYRPILEYKAPGNEQLPLNVQGQIVVEKQNGNAKYIFDNVQVSIPNDKVISLKGNLGHDGRDVFTDLTLSDGSQSGSLKGRVHAEPDVLKFNAEVKNTINPLVNFNLIGEIKRQPGQYDSSLQITHGQDLSSKLNKITFSNSLIRKYKSPQEFIFGIKTKFSYPLVAVDTKFEFEETARSLDYDLEIQYGDIKFGSELEVEINKKQKGDLNLDFKIYGLDNKVKFQAKREVKGEESKISNELDINGAKLKVDGTIKHHIQPSNINVGADLTVVLPTHPTPFKVNSGLKYNPNELDAHHKVSSGKVIVIDAHIKFNKQGTADGSVKVNVENILVVNGHLKSNKGNGNGNLLIDAKNIKKQIKIESTFQIQSSSTYNIDVTLYPLFGQDKKQKIVISTHNKLTPNSADSKNVLDVLGKKLTLNLKGQTSGDDNNKKCNGELELTLPNDQYLLGKINVDRKISNDILNGHCVTSLEYRKNKNAAGQKASLQATYKNTNPKESLYDITYNFAADDSNGKNINADLTIKSSVNGKEVSVELGNKIYGTILKNPLTFQLNSKYKNGVSGSYDATASYGPNAVLKVKGNQESKGEGKPCSGDIEIQLTTPSKQLQTLKAQLAGTFLKSKNPSDNSQIELSGSIFADDDGSVPEPIIDIKAEGLVRATDKDGEIRGSVNCPKLGPISVAAGYSRVDQGAQQQLNGNIGLQYGNGKNFKIDGSLIRPDKLQYKLDAELQTPHENFKKSTLSLHTKRSEDYKHITSKLVLNTDSKVYTLNTELKESDINPLIDIKLKDPEGKLSQIYLKGNKVSEKEFGGEVKFVYQPSNFLLEANSNANVNSIEEFHIKGNINSPSLKLNKVSYDVQNKPGKTGRKIQVTIKSAGKNVLSGTTGYQAREEQGKYIVEGSGTFKVKEESKSANFKYICQRLSLEKNGEQGIEVSFDASLGNKAIDAEIKTSNKQFRYLVSYCEKTKECAHIEIDSKLNKNDINNYDHGLEIIVDLRKLGLSHEFGLKSSTTRKEYVLDHTVDVHFQSQENSKYQYSVYIHPKEAGVSFTTPKRIIALEGKVQVPKDLTEGGKVSAQVAFYLDKKNQPDKKAGVGGWLNIDKQARAINGECKLTHPGLSKALAVSLKTIRNGEAINGETTIIVELDVFANTAQKIVATYKSLANINTQTYSAQFKESIVVKSSGLGINIESSTESKYDKQTYSGEYSAKFKYHVGNSNYDSALSLKGSKSQQDFLLRILNVDVLKVANKFIINKEEQVVDSVVSSYNDNAVITHLEIKNFNTLLYTIHSKNTPKNKVQFNAGLIPGQIADIRADHVTAAGKNNIFYATLKLDGANFLKPDYNVNSKEIESVLTIVKKRISDYILDLSKTGTEWTNDIRKQAADLTELSKTGAINLEPVKEYYTSEFKKIKNEILDDKSVQEFIDNLKKVFGAVFESVGEIISKLSKLVEVVVRDLNVAFAGVLESINKELLPQLKELVGKITTIFADIAKTLIDIIAGYLTIFSQLIEKYQPSIKQLAATFGELGQDIGRFIQKSYEQVRLILLDLSQKIYNEIKALPIFDELKAQYEDFIKNGLPSTEGIIGGLKEVSSTIKDIIPPEFVIEKEIVEIIDITIEYLEKKLSHQPIDDLAVFNKLTAVSVRLVKKIVAVISTPTYEVPQTDVPVSLDFLKKLPKLVAIKFSPIAYLLRDDPVEEVLGFLVSLATHPRKWFVPFPLEAIVVQGQHIFTFDGKHLTFPGNCKYLLARDAVYGNFTVVGTYVNGELDAITLADQHDSITVQKNGKVLLNGAATELPARKPELSAFRNYEIISIFSTAGVKIYCVPDLSGCGISISGFYHGQVKGLLGNGNNEPYDDFTAASGKIVTNEGEFGNSYKIGNCPAVNVPKHENHPENAACNKLFGWESTLRYCYPFVSTKNFKIACAHGKASNSKNIEVDIAKAYVAACHSNNIPIRVPSELLQCTNSEKPFAVGDTFSVKLPGKAADIILLVDTIKSNEIVYKEFLQPLVLEVAKTLQSKGISDIDFHLIAYGGENQWPSHVTVGGKLTFKDKAPNLKFTEAPKKKPTSGSIIGNLRPYVELLEQIIYDVQLGLGLNLQARTYSEGIDYPFRSNAVKSVIAITSQPCEVGRLHVLQKLRTLLFKNNQISLNLVTPFQELIVKDSQKTKDVIGFNNQRVFTVSQSKEKPGGTAELYKSLHYEDYCVDFTVKNRGNVFVTDNFINSQGDVKKQFVHSASHNIIEQLLNVEQGLDCECKVVNQYTAHNVCREVYSKDRLTRRA